MLEASVGDLGDVLISILNQRLFAHGQTVQCPPAPSGLSLVSLSPLRLIFCSPAESIAPLWTLSLQRPFHCVIMDLLMRCGTFSDISFNNPELCR